MKLDAPAARRNREPILEVLRSRLPEPPETGTVLEIASGTGQHAAFFAEHLPHLRWQPSEREVDNLLSIAEWVRDADLDNVETARRLDVTNGDWDVGTYDAIFNANMIHISPWETGMALLRGASLHLRPGGQLFLYGPFRVGGEHTAPSNEAFDTDLRRRDARWGVRDLEAVRDAAAVHGLELEQAVAMPANNQVLVFRYSGGSK
ncbi:MAG: DUF938 domain-containing protein [Deltaproteobacteria bacterium]|nr:DUF938 domain-containing protein [Deltaproteobacteria bacterium]MBW2414936.1 DUF938 domain-containing protein [Deltaproteobacteria bacterium]